MLCSACSDICHVQSSSPCFQCLFWWARLIHFFNCPVKLSITSEYPGLYSVTSLVYYITQHRYLQIQSARIVCHPQIKFWDVLLCCPDRPFLYSITSSIMAVSLDPFLVPTYLICAAYILSMPLSFSYSIVFPKLNNMIVYVASQQLFGHVDICHIHSTIFEGPMYYISWCLLV